MVGIPFVLHKAPLTSIFIISGKNMFNFQLKHADIVLIISSHFLVVVSKLYFFPTSSVQLEIHSLISVFLFANRD